MGEIKKIVYHAEDLKVITERDYVELHTLEGIHLKTNKEILGDLDQFNDHNFYSLYWHRDDGPALIKGDGTWEYWFNNKMHRLDGPAYNYIDDDGKMQYGFEFFGTSYTDKVMAWVEENVTDITQFTEQEVFLMKLAFSEIMLETEWLGK